MKTNMMGVKSQNVSELIIVSASIIANSANYLRDVVSVFAKK